MQSNPMQRKIRNSFLFGVLTMLLIALLIGAIVFFIVIKPEMDKKKEEEKVKGVEKLVYVLNVDVKSGEIITSDMLTEIKLYENVIPADTVNSSLISTMEMQDKNGNMLLEDGEGRLFMYQEDNYAYKSISSREKDKVLIEQDEVGFYKTKTIDNEKEYIELLNAPVVAKVDLKANTILTTGIVAKSDEIITDSVRYMEYNMITMPTTLDIGSCIDIRLRLQNGQDLIVISKKEIVNLYGQTVGLNLSEEEILILNSAIVEAYIMPSAELYMATYIEPGRQIAATHTYIPTQEVRYLIEMDGNIVNEAKQELRSLYGTTAEGFSDSGIRQSINNQVNSYAGEASSNIEAGMQEQIQAARQARENYLSGLEGY